MHLVLVAVLSLGALVLLHEAGHLLAARLFRMRVEVFSIGFGPALLSFRGRQTEYRLSLVPLGGYVRIAGMAPGDAPADDPASFRARPAWQRLVVLLAGPLLNWLLAFALLAGLYACGFRVPTDEPVLEEVRGPKAAAAGLMPGDRVLAVGTTEVQRWGELTRALAAHAGRPVTIRVLRNEVELALTARLGPEGRLLITPQSRVVRYPFGEALGLAFLKTFALVGQMLDDLKDWVGGEGDAQPMGPVGLVAQTVEAARRDALALLQLLVLISLGLAVMNLLPLPALDGARVVFVLAGAARRRAIDAHVETAVHGLGALALLVFVGWLTWREVGPALSAGDEAGPPDAGVQAPRG